MLERFGILIGALAVAVFVSSISVPGLIGQSIYFFWIGILSLVYFVLVCTTLNGYRQRLLRIRTQISPDVIGALPDVDVPLLVRSLAILCSIAAPSLFVAMSLRYGPGGPVLTDGKIKWVNDGAVVRLMTANDYWKYNADMITMVAALSAALAFSGIWINRVVKTRDRFIREKYLVR